MRSEGASAAARMRLCVATIDYEKQLFAPRREGGVKAPDGFNPVGTGTTSSVTARGVISSPRYSSRRAVGKNMSRWPGPSRQTVRCEAPFPEAR